MSETDDTDDLLLIPPDFFVIDTEQDIDNKLSVPYYSVFDTLITQVNSLESRLSLIECTSADPSLNNSLSSNSSFMFGNQRLQNFDEGPSTQSTPQKPRTKFQLSSLPSSPNDRASPKRPSRTNLFATCKVPEITSQKEHNERVTNENKQASLLEVDNFIRSVNTIKRFTDRPKSDVSKGSKFQLGEKSTQHVPYVEMQEPSTSSASSEKFIEKQQTWKPGETIGSVPDQGFGLRNAFYAAEPSNTSEQHNDNVTILGVQGLLRSISTSDDSSNDLDKVAHSLNSSESTQTTALQNLGHQRKDTELQTCSSLSTPSKDVADDFTLPSPRKFKTKYSVPDSCPDPLYTQSSSTNEQPGSLGLLSLKDLWNQNGTNIDPSNSFQRLEEERLRRQHCEHIITELQTRILELQEKLAVAVQVDQAKDEALNRFRNTCMGVSERMHLLQRDKQSLEESIAVIKRRNEDDLKKAFQKMSYCENEMEKAIHLAHSNQDKLAAVERQCNGYKKMAENLENSLKIAENNCAMELQKNKQFAEILAQKDLEIGQNKKLITDARREIAQSKKAVEATQEELGSIKSECTQLRLKLHEERQKNSNVEDQQKRIQGELDFYKNNEKALKEDMEKQKADIKSYYQNQVEVVVNEKLQEFQQELERVESCMKEEYRLREHSLAKTAAGHIHQISEKHSLEVTLLEEKHKEESRLYEIKIRQLEQHSSTLHNKYERLYSRWNNMSKKMEAQLMETMKLFNIARSPSSPNPNDDTIEQINSLKSRSASHLKELLSLKNEMPDFKATEMNTVQVMTAIPESLSSVIEASDRRELVSEEIPVSNKPQRRREQEIQKYVQMLLDKMDGDCAQVEGKKHEERLEENASEDKKDKGNGQRDRKEKPPWK